MLAATAIDDLFAKAPAKRQRKWTGIEPPEPSERDIHEACAIALDRLLLKPALWFCYPAGATQLSPQQMARYSRMGLKRGMPDLWVLHRGVYCVELKRKGGRLSKTYLARTRRGSPRILAGQEEVFPALIASGGVTGIVVAHSVDEMLDALEGWGVPLRPHRRW
jgi:hypothetical protein